MSEQPLKSDPTTAMGLILALVRENGLVTVSLLVLVWCVWYLGEMNTAQDTSWNQTVGMLRTELDDMRETRLQYMEKLQTRLATLEETNRTVMHVMADLEEECLNRKPTPVESEH